MINNTLSSRYTFENSIIDTPLGQCQKNKLISNYVGTRKMIGNPFHDALKTDTMTRKTQYDFHFESFSN